ncbi:MAG TPA: DUF2783 domain-containing protein [Burkholderiales bacterium]|nr:DUF2783 domain-containing protein [Burkholderiales bacterium]
MCDANRFYQALFDAHGETSEEESAQNGAGLNVRLVFILANQIADSSVLASVLEAAAGRSHRDAAPVESAS